MDINIQTKFNNCTQLDISGAVFGRNKCNYLHIDVQNLVSFENEENHSPPGRSPASRYRT
jgi:hypothetical protein